MDRGAWQATVHGVTRVRHDLATKERERDCITPNESKSESCSVVSDSLGCHGLYSPWNSPGQITGVGCHALLQGFFPTEGSN